MPSGASIVKEWIRGALLLLGPHFSSALPFSLSFFRDRGECTPPPLPLLSWLPVSCVLELFLQMVSTWAEAIEAAEKLGAFTLTVWLSENSSSSSWTSSCESNFSPDETELKFIPAEVKESEESLGVSFLIFGLLEKFTCFSYTSSWKFNFFPGGTQLKFVCAKWRMQGRN